MRTLLATAALLLLSACGGGSDDADASKSAAGDGTPKCSEVWVAGKTLPKDYEGCTNGGTVEASVTYECTDGGELAGYDDRFFALLGGPIEAQTDETYAAAFDKCKPS